MGLLENIDIRDLKVAKRKPGIDQELIDLQERLVNFQVQKFERVLERDLCPEAPPYDCVISGSKKAGWMTRSSKR